MYTYIYIHTYVYIYIHVYIYTHTDDTLAILIEISNTLLRILQSGLDVNHISSLQYRKSQISKHI